MAVDINGDGLIALGGTSTTQGRVRLAEDTDNGTNYVELTAPALLASNVTVTMPNANGTLINTDPGTSGNVLTSNGTAWLSQAISAGGDYIMTAYTTPATWTKPAGLKAVKVTVVGAGGNGGSGGTTPPICGSPGSATTGGCGGGGGAAILYLDAPAVPGPITVTVGTAPSKTSSFGPLVSATGGTNGTDPGSSPTPAPVGPYAGGAGSGGTINLTGMAGTGSTVGPGMAGGGSALGLGQGLIGRATVSPASTPVAGVAGLAYGGGGQGGRGPGTGASGGAGIVIVEEFY